MEWITAVLGALIAVLAMQLHNWRTMAKLSARIQNLERTLEELQEPDEPPVVDHGQQCTDLSDEYRNMLTKSSYNNLLPKQVRDMDTPLPVIRHMTVPALLNLLPRKGIRVQPSLDGMGIKVVASYFCHERYRREIGADLDQDMKELVANTGPGWELAVFHNEEMMQYEYRILNHDGGVHE